MLFSDYYNESLNSSGLSSLEMSKLEIPLFLFLKICLILIFLCYYNREGKALYNSMIFIFELM